MWDINYHATVTSSYNMRNSGLEQYKISIRNSILNSNLVKSLWPITYFSVVESFCNFVQNMAMILPWSVQNFKTIWQLTWMSWKNEHWWDLSLTWVLHRLPLRARYGIFLVSSDTDFCTFHCYTVIDTRYLGIILYMCPANERWCYIVTSSDIGWTHTQNDPWEPTSQLTHWGRDKIDAISQTTYSNAFSWMKMNEFRLWFHWSLFLRFKSTISHHWFR